MKILAIETSCDETSIAIVETKGSLPDEKTDGKRCGKNPSFNILSNIILSQIKIHEKWGGVVPMLAKREHQLNLIPILKKALVKSNLLIFNSQFSIIKKYSKNKLNKILGREPELLERFLNFIPTIKIPRIDAIAVTVGPGLEPALWVGINFAKAIAAVWDKPIIGVNHMEGHLAAVLLSQGRETHKPQFPVSKKNSKNKLQKSKIIQFPAIALLVSGGHTELVLIKKWGDYEIIGETRDDAAGECFDKTARILELPYPGGPQISKYAENFKKYPLTFRLGGWARREIEKEALNIKLPRPMAGSKDYDFSFSGLKTATLYMIKEMKGRNVNIGDFTPMICNEIQQSIIDVLVAKTIRAAKDFSAKSIILGGGVVANKELRRQIRKTASREMKTTTLYLPLTKFTTDNAAMISAAGYLSAIRNNLCATKNSFTKTEKLVAQGNLRL